MGSTSQHTNFSDSSTIPLWLDGKQVTTTSSFSITSPLTVKPLYKSSAASESDALAAVQAAAIAQPAWAATKPAERRDLFLRAADECVKRKDELWHYCRTETGSTEPYFDFDYNDMLQSIRTCAGLITSAMDGSLPTMAEEGRSAMLVQEPYGVVLSIAPWNAPCILGTRSFLGPLAMGNTVVLKGPEKAPACYWALADIFHAAGLPAGCLNTIIHDPADGAKITSALIAAPQVKKVNFTGSTNIGAVIAGLAGKHLKPVLMELGGKAPAIVCEDADLQLAALNCTLGSFLYSGQICMSTERILVNAKVAEKFKEVLKQTIDQVFGQEQNGMVLVDKLPVQKNKQLLEDALGKGAKALYGDVGKVGQLDLATAMKPIVLEGIKEGMDLYYTESFGPTVSLFEVQSDEEAIQIANDTDYGLASAVFTEDLRRGLKIAKQIETGAVHINSKSYTLSPAFNECVCC